MIAHYIKSFTLWEFVKAHWLTNLCHAGLDPASRLHRTGAQKLSGTPDQVRGDVEGAFA